MMYTIILLAIVIFGLLAWVGYEAYIAPTIIDADSTDYTYNLDPKPYKGEYYVRDLDTDKIVKFSTVIPNDLCGKTVLVQRESSYIIEKITEHSGNLLPVTENKRVIGADERIIGVIDNG